jgi:hypothetical protein
MRCFEMGLGHENCEGLTDIQNINNLKVKSHHMTKPFWKAAIENICLIAISHRSQGTHSDLCAAKLGWQETLYK